MKRIRTVILATMIATASIAQGVIDVHSHIITPEFVSSLESEGRLMDEGFPLPEYNVEKHLKWMDEAGVQTSVLTLAAPQPSSPGVVRQANEAAARIKRQHPGRFLFCAALPLPDVGATEPRPPICLFPMQSAEDSTHIRILEIYVSEEAYQSHLKTDHFQKYKQGTLHMVKTLRLPAMHPLDPQTMNQIFRKHTQKHEAKKDSHHPSAISHLILFVLLICCTSGSEAKAGVPYPEASGEIGKTLVVYYSYTGNCRNIVSALTDQIEADVLEIQPADKGQRYEANGYALGTQLLNAIKANPDDPASYPPIDPVSTTLTDYRNIIVVTPLWWSQMAAIMQTYLFNYGPQMAGKTIAMIVSSSSSGISGVVADCKRLVPDATWAGDALWIKDSNRRNTATLVQEWLSTQNFQSSQTNQMTITIDGQSHSVTLADTQAAQQLAARLHDGPVTATLSSSSDFEIWGPLGFSLPTSNEQITAKPGDVILYNGSNICLFYGTNTWSYTRLGHIDGLTESELRTFLKAGESRITVTLSLEADPTAIKSVEDSRAEEENYYTLNGVKVAHPTKGLYVKGGKKIAL